MLDSIGAFLREAAPGCCLPWCARRTWTAEDPRPVENRADPPAGVLHWLPERPIFAAMKLVQKERASCRSAPISAATCSARCRRSRWGARRWAMALGLRPMRLSMAGASGARLDHRGRRFPAQRAVVQFHQHGVQQVGQRGGDRGQLLFRGHGGQDIMSSRADNPTKATKHPISKALKGIGSTGCARWTAPMTWAGCATCCARR